MRQVAIGSVTMLALLTMTSLVIAQGSRSAPSTGAAPGDGAPLPNAERPLTHDELLAVRGEHPMWAAPETILVADATIVTDQAMRGRVCRPNRPNARKCAVGVLSRRGDEPADPVVILRRKERTRMGAVGASIGIDGSSIDGRMAYARSIDSLRLLGPVQSPNGTYLTPIEPTAMASADSLPVGSMIVVRGWLSVLRGEDACPRVPRALDGRRDGWDSPFVRCPGGWLTVDEVGQTDPADPLVPAAFGIAVQFGALDRYGDDRSASPEFATFLLRHEQNPLDGMEPHLGWKAVGRLDAPQAIPMPTPPVLEELARPGGLEWRPVVRRQPPADNTEVLTTEWAGGFASVHSGVDRVLSSWVSADGVEWQAADLPTDITSVSTLLELREGLVLIANVRGSEESQDFEAWRSTDGLAWRRAGKQRLLTPRGFERVGRGLTGFGSLGDRVVFVDTFARARSSKARSRSAAYDGDYPLQAGRRRTDVTYAWTTRDGRSWRRQLATGLGRTPRDFEMVQGDGELLLLHERRPEIRQSTDGVHWRRIGTYPEDVIPEIWALTRVEGGFVLVGEPIEGGYGQGNFLVVWRQADDGTWERVAERPSRMPTAAIASGSTVIIAGDRFDFTNPDDPSDPTFVPFILVSTDGGRTWDESLEWTDDRRWCLGALSLAEHEGTVLLDASCAPQDAATKYIYEAQESIGSSFRAHAGPSGLPSRSWASPKGVAPRVFKVGTLREALDLPVPGTPRKDPGVVSVDAAVAPAPSGTPIDDSFPWPVLTPPYDVPLPPVLQSSGPPDASTTKHGIRIELWLSARTATSGAWVRAVVKSTNLRDTPAWSMPSACGGSGTVMTVDPRSGIPPGVEQQGNAAELKKKAVRRGPYLWSGFDRRKDVLRFVTSSAATRPSRTLLECPIPSEPRRLKPHATVTERFAWYPASSFDEGNMWFQPLWPGTAAVTVSWPFLGRGDEPSGSSQDLWQRIKRIKTTANIEIGGDGPGTPSIPELVDNALADPRFRAWVDEDPTRKSWNGVGWLGASGPTYPHNLASIGFEDAPPNGLLWLELGRRHVQRGVVTLDPWTGEVLRVHCIGPSQYRPCEGAAVLDEALE